MDSRSSIPRIVALILGAILGVGFGVIVTDTTDDGNGHTTTTTRTIIVKAPAPSAKAPPRGDLETVAPAQLRDETPASVPAEVLKAATDAELERAKAAGLPPVDQPLPVAGAQGYQCRTDYASRGYGTRAASARVMQFVLHYTVSANVPGWADVDGVGDYLERVGLSAHDIIDFEGHCEHKVPYARNAYTEGAFNSESDSVEIIATGRETRAQWLASPLIHDGILAALTRDRLKARGLPLRFVDPVGCAARLGYTDHNHLECGNNHVDVSPNFPFDVFARQVRATPRARITAGDRRDCKAVHAYRLRRRAGRPRTSSGTAAFERRKGRVRAHGLRCLDGTPRRLQTTR